MYDEDQDSILVVDDNENARKSLSLIFVKKGYHVETAATGKETIEKIKRKFFNVALLDIKLPDMDGVELIAPLKEMHPDMAIVMVTAYASLENAVQALNRGASFYITKPVNMDEVLSTIREALEKQRLLRENRQLVYKLQRELAERKRAEEELKRHRDDLEEIVQERTAELEEALKEKEILLKEIHHRVKNNLQIIIALLNIQSRFIEDTQSLKVFRDSRERIRTMAIVHEKLYQSSDLAKINSTEYIHSLISHIYQSYSLKPGQVRFNKEIEEMDLDANTSIPLGLIINELVSNALKHAFPGGRQGEVQVKLQKNKKENEKYNFTLTVRDDGIGFPRELDCDNCGSLGMILVRSLVKQLHGVIKIDRKEGTTFTIKFEKLAGTLPLKKNE